MKLSLRFSSLVPLTMLVLLLAGTLPHPASAMDLSTSLGKITGKMTKLFTSKSATSSSSSHGIASGSNARYPSEAQLALETGSRDRNYEEQLGYFLTQDAYERLEIVLNDLVEMARPGRRVTADEVGLLFAKLDNVATSATEEANLAHQEDIESWMRAFASQLASVKENASSRHRKNDVTPDQLEETSVLTWNSFMVELRELILLDHIVEWLVENQARFRKSQKDVLGPKLDALVSGYNERMAFCMAKRDPYERLHQDTFKETGRAVNGGDPPSIHLLGTTGRPGSLPRALVLGGRKKLHLEKVY